MDELLTATGRIEGIDLGKDLQASALADENPHYLLSPKPVVPLDKNGLSVGPSDLGRARQLHKFSRSRSSNGDIVAYISDGEVFPFSEGAGDHAPSWP